MLAKAPFVFMMRVMSAFLLDRRTSVMVPCRRGHRLTLVSTLGNARQELLHLCGRTWPNCLPHMPLSTWAWLGLAYIYLVNVRLMARCPRHSSVAVRGLWTSSPLAGLPGLGPARPSAAVPSVLDMILNGPCFVLAFRLHPWTALLLSPDLSDVPIR